MSSKRTYKRSQKPVKVPAAAAAYVDGVQGGTITAGRLVSLACQRFAEDCKAAQLDPNFPYYFDHGAAVHALQFFDYLHHSKGEWGGQKFKLQGWQAFVITAVFGWMRRSDDTRRYRVAMITTARKSGKSTTAAAVGLYLFCGDGEPGAEVVTASTKREQSKIVHSEAVRMVQASPHLRGEIRLVADRAKRVPAAGQVIGQEHIAGPKSTHGTIPDSNLRLSRQTDDVLPAWRRMPVVEIAHRQ